MKVKVINVSNNNLPKHETESSSGIDLRANITIPIKIKPGERELIPCGIKVELPEGYEMQVRPRSGNAVKHGIHIHLGTIDSDYRGEVHALVYNLGRQIFVVDPGDRIAQGVLSKFERFEFEEVEELSETERNEKGFGSTGI